MGKKLDKTTELKVSATVEEPNFVVGSFFNGLQIPKESHFDVYRHKSNDNEFVLHGENSTLEYNGQTSNDDDLNDYVVALYDPLLKALELFKAPMITASVTSLASRVHKGPKIKLRGVQNYAQRVALGEAFGTKKAKKIITDSQRNSVNAEKLLNMEMDIVDNIKETTAILPTQKDLEGLQPTSGPVPPADESATSVEDIYALDTLIPPEEFAAIRISGVMDEPDVAKRMDYMVDTKSPFVQKNLPKFIANGDERKVKMLYYASLLIAVYSRRMDRSKSVLMENLSNQPSEYLLDGVLDRFTLSRGTRGKERDKAFLFDPFHTDKLLLYLLALVFHIEDFLIEILPLAHELNLRPMKMNTLLKAMGANIKNMPLAMAEALDLSKKEAAIAKVATLKVPFTKPDMTKRFVR